MQSGSDSESTSANVSFVANITSTNEGGGNENVVTVTLVNNQRSATVDSDTLKRHVVTPPRVDLSRSDLIRLLSYLEGELQARDIVIATLKADKAKQMLYQAKYGRLGLNDPFAALQRDSETCCSNDDFDEASVGRLYESQLAHLERLIAVQRRAHQRAKQVLAAAERRHARSVRELEQERKRRAHDAAQGDDVCMMLEKERERLKQELENQKCDQAKVERDLEKARQLLTDGKERHKQIVVYLLQERRQLLVRLMEERQKNLKTQQQQQQLSAAAPVSAEEDSGASRKSNGEKTEEDLIKELEQLRKQLENEKKETSSLKEVVRAQEEDLNLIRQMILAKSRQAASQQPSPTTAAARTPGQSKTAKSDGSNGNMVSPAHPATTPTSPSAAHDGRYQVASRPSASGSIAQQPPGQRNNLQHYASADVGAVTSVAALQLQQPIRLLTNPAYQQPTQYQAGASVGAKGAPAITAAIRGRSVPPPAPHQPIPGAARGSPSINDRADTSSTQSSSAYAAPRVIPIQYIGPTPNTSAATTVVNSHQQHQQYASVSAGGLRRPGVVSAPSPTGHQGGMVSAARNYVSNVVAAVTNAATNSPLLAGNASRRGQTTAVAPSTTGSGSPLREQWSYAAHATSSTSPSCDPGGYRPHPTIAANANRVGATAPAYSASHQQQPHPQSQPPPPGSVSRKGNAPARTASAPGHQQVSGDGNGPFVIEVGQREMIEPALAQLQAVVNLMAGAPGSNPPPPYGPAGAHLDIGRMGTTSRVASMASRDDPYGVKIIASRRPPPSPSHLQQFQSQTGGENGNSSVNSSATMLRNRPPSPASNMVQQRPQVANGMVVQSSVAVSATATHGSKRTPTPAPSCRTPLPPPANGGPVPAVRKTSALSNSPTLPDCNPTLGGEKQERRSSPSAATSQGTLGRKVKAVSGLANKLQKRVVAGVVGQAGSRQRKGSGDSNGKDQNVRSTQV